MSSFPPPCEGSECFSIASWNVTGLSEARVERISEFQFHVIALQETHLSSFPLRQRCLTAKRCNMQLLHGRTPSEDYGGHLPGGASKSRGVGFLLGPSVSATQLHPVGKAWKLLWLARRLHVIDFPPRRGLPRGLRVVSVYAPVASSSLEALSESSWFCDTFLDFVTVLDMNVPTILCGDWNGTVHPDKDFETGGLAKHRQCSDLLSRLLGPGGPFLDTMDLFPSEWDFTFWGGTGCSRCDSILVNRAAAPFIKSFKILSDIRDGGHSPIELILKVVPLRLNWYPPRPQIPECLRQSLRDLRSSEDHTRLLQKWMESEAFRKLDATPSDNLSFALKAALEELVSLAGGWDVKERRSMKAYDSKAVRTLRRELQALNFAHSQLRRWPSGPSPRPFLVDQALKKLRNLGIFVDVDRQTSIEQIRSLIRGRRGRLNGILAQMRLARRCRWKDAMPNVWAHSPRRLFAWLREEQASWGSTPLISEEGAQLTTAEEVDSAAKEFWVKGLWCKDDPGQADQHWRDFSSSEFFPFIPRCSWDEIVWTSDIVKSIVLSMKQSAPGTWGVPVAVWQTLPDVWHAAVARLLQQIQETGDWPDNLMDAYVVLIPKGQGNEIKSQRPITVLELIFRIFAKGVVHSWRKTLTGEYLGEYAMGFRASSGSRHLAQFLSDVIASRTSEGKEVWVAKFDLWKCYDSVPWWALWGMMSEAGMSRRTIRAFRQFYERLRRHFRFGHVDGSSWCSHNGLAQGCPAAPDMLNLLLEPFHRWAAANGFGVSLWGVSMLLPLLLRMMLCSWLRPVKRSSALLQLTCAGALFLVFAFFALRHKSGVIDLALGARFALETLWSIFHPR